MARVTPPQRINNGGAQTKRALRLDGGVAARRMFSKRGARWRGA